MKTHAQHLKDYNSEETSTPEAQAAWKELTTKFGINNVWDFRIFDQVFDYSQASFTFGIMFNARHKETDKIGSLDQGSINGSPRFYFNFR